MQPDDDEPGAAEPDRADQPAGDTGRPTTSSRRAFLRTAGIAAAGAAVGGVAGGAIGASIGARPAVQPEHETGEEYPPLPAPDKPGFDHLIVLMYENRSFDNLLGYLYDEKTLPKGRRFDGLAFGDYSNPDPAGGVIPAHPYQGTTDFVMRQPSPDPGEAYPHVNTQLFGTVDPASNATAKERQMLPPFNAPPAGTEPRMKGFVQDYVDELRKDLKREPVPDEYRRVMGSFTPDMLPVFSTLARQFAVYDDWHCAVPSQTFCNRSFFHASTSHGYVTNGGAAGLKKWFDTANASPTIFNRLEEAGISWRVYFDDRQLISLTGFIHAPVLEPYWHTNFRTMTDFYRDVAEGTLPAYAFVEPRLLYDHNDMHPPGGPMTEEDVDGEVIVGGAISDVRAGDLLLHQVYSAVRSSRSAKGSNALNTMLLVTFDEHGGTYDHAVPGPATPPDASSGPGEMGFGFDRLGLRVPAIAISAYTARNTIINEEMHHAAVVSTLVKKHRLRHLTDRDRGARTIDNAINRSTPRQPGTWPDTHPQYLPANPEEQAPAPGDDDRPLSPPGIGLVGLLQARYGLPEDATPRTYKEAYEAVTRLGTGLFGAQ